MTKVTKDLRSNTSVSDIVNKLVTKVPETEQEIDKLAEALCKALKAIGK